MVSAPLVSDTPSLTSTRYHGKCLKIARGKIKDDDKYTCPICDYRVKIPRDAARPKLEDLLMWQSELSELPFQPDEEATLNNIVTQAVDFRAHIAHLLNPMMSTPEELSVQRFYLRKIEGADVLLAEETNFLRAELHRWAPVAPNPPPKIETSLSTRKPRPTKQQKLMKEMGIENPDDIPMHLRPKKAVPKWPGEPPVAPGQPRPARAPLTVQSSLSHGHLQHGRSHTPPGEPPASVLLTTATAKPAEHWSGPGYRPPPTTAQGASAPQSRRESLAAGPNGSSGLFNAPSSDDQAAFSQSDEPSMFSTNSASAPAAGALDPSLFDAPPSASSKTSNKGHNRNISDAGPAPSFGMEDQDAGESFFASNMANMAGEALGLAAGDDSEQPEGSAAKDMADEFLA